MSPNQPHPSLALRPADRPLWLGVAAMAAPRMRGELWVVFHPEDGWTHLYRVDGRDTRIVHLVRCGEGDCRAALAAWARLHLIGAAPTPARDEAAPICARRDHPAASREAA